MKGKGKGRKGKVPQKLAISPHFLEISPGGQNAKVLSTLSQKVRKGFSS